MKITILFTISLILSNLSYNLTYANSGAFVQKQIPQFALTWSEARSLCRSQGKNWDLPTMDQVLSENFIFSDANKVSMRELKSQNIKNYYLVWTRANDEVLNHQLVELSQALKIDNASERIDSYIITPKKVEMLKAYLHEITEKADIIARSSENQRILIQFLEQYNSTQLGVKFPIDADLPLSEQPEYISYIPADLLPTNILQILTRPSAKYLQTEIENIQFELGIIFDGLSVTCIRES